MYIRTLIGYNCYDLQTQETIRFCLDCWDSTKINRYPVRKEIYEEEDEDTFGVICNACHCKIGDWTECKYCGSLFRPETESHMCDALQAAMEQDSQNLEEWEVETYTESPCGSDAWREIKLEPVRARTFQEIHLLLEYGYFTYTPSSSSGSTWRILKQEASYWKYLDWENKRYFTSSDMLTEILHQVDIEEWSWYPFVDR